MDEMKENEVVVTAQRPSMTQNSITPLRTHVWAEGWNVGFWASRNQPAMLKFSDQSIQTNRKGVNSWHASW